MKSRIVLSYLLLATNPSDYFHGCSNGGTIINKPPFFASAASGYCSGTAARCNTVFASTTCIDSTSSSGISSCPVIIDSCDVLCERGGATNYNSPCRCRISPLGCTEGLFSSCESSIICDGFPNCANLKNSLDCYFTKGCEWSYESDNDPSPTGVPVADVDEDGDDGGVLGSNITLEAGNNGSSSILPTAPITMVEEDGEEGVENDNVVVNDGEEDGDGSNVVVVDDGDSEEDGDDSDVDVNENDGETVEDGTSSSGESNSAVVEDNEGGEDVDGGNDEDGSIDLVDGSDGEKDEASVAMTIDDEKAEDGKSITTAVEDNDGETYANGDNVFVDGEGEETVGNSISVTIDDENEEDGESNKKSTIDDASESSDSTSLPFDSTSSDRSQFFKGHWKAHMALGVFIIYFANI
mmetsp:Transcript_19127/g.41701  ORF Transcript_19127/g.41701 Transcript_19127/m.41701 type:complete len:410 (+) Transcript_19127:106-1335(+)